MGKLAHFRIFWNTVIIIWAPKRDYGKVILRRNNFWETNKEDPNSLNEIDDRISGVFQ